MEEILIKTIEEKIQNLEETKLERIEQMKKEQKLDVAYVKLTKYKEEALAEIENHGNGSKEASSDLEKIENELEKLKIAESDITKKVEDEISTTKKYLIEVNEIVSEKEKAQKEKENVDKGIKDLLKHKEEALAEIEKNGDVAKEAKADLEKIEAELEEKNKIKEENQKIIEKADKKINEFLEKSDVKKIIEEKINEDWDKAIKENEEFDKNHVETRPGSNQNSKPNQSKEISQSQISQGLKSQNENPQNENLQDENSQGKNPQYENSQDENSQDENLQNKRNKIILAINDNKIEINGQNKLFYKSEAENRKSLIEEYAINSQFITNKKAKKYIDYSLISALKEIDDKNDTLVNAYLEVIRNGEFQSESVKECVEKLNNAVDIEYKFDREKGILTNLREKILARNAKKLGIATLDGISEKGLFEKIKDKFSKFKNIKLLKGKEEQKALESGEKTKAQDQKAKTIDLIQKDREQLGLRDRVKVENNNNEIERRVQEVQKETEEQIGRDVQNIQRQDEEQK